MALTANVRPTTYRSMSYLMGPFMLFLLPITSLGYAQISLGLGLAVVGCGTFIFAAAWRHGGFRVLLLLAVGAMASGPGLSGLTLMHGGRTFQSRQAFHEYVSLVTVVAVVAVA